MASRILPRPCEGLALLVACVADNGAEFADAIGAGTRLGDEPRAVHVGEAVPARRAVEVHALTPNPRRIRRSQVMSVISPGKQPVDEMRTGDARNLVGALDPTAVRIEPAWHRFRGRAAAGPSPPKSSRMQLARDVRVAPRAVGKIPTRFEIRVFRLRCTVGICRSQRMLRKSPIHANTSRNKADTALPHAVCLSYIR